MKSRLRAVVVPIAVAIGSLAAATIAVALLQDVLGVPNPSAVYLVAVVATALVAGTAGAIAAAVASFLLYNFLFTEPRYTLAMNEPGVWLSVVLLLFVGVVVGQLVALQRARAETARRRASARRGPCSGSAALWRRAIRPRPCWAASRPVWRPRRTCPRCGSGSGRTTRASA